MRICFFFGLIILLSCGEEKVERSELVVDAENIDSFSVIWESDYDSILVYQEGKYLENIPNVYGGNGFLLYYNDEYVGNVGHFKTRDSDIYSYKITILKDENNYYKLHFIADGIGSTSIHCTFYNGVLIR